MTDLLLQQLVNGLSIGMGYALVALGLTLIFGVLHILNFAHGELFMVGGLVTVVLANLLGWPYLATIPAAGLGVAALAWLVDQVAVRPLAGTPDGPSTALLTTFAAGLLIQQAVLASWGAQPSRVDGLQGVLRLGPVMLTVQRAFVFGAGLALLAGVELVLRHTRFGQSLRALSQNGFAAQVVGIDVRRARSLTYVVAAALAGVTGALLTPVILFSRDMGASMIINAFVIVVVGGMGNAAGAAACGLLLGVCEALLSSFVPQEIGTALIYSLLLLTLLIRPHGLFARG